MTAQLALLENHLGLEVPVAPPATDEQLVAPLDGTIEGKYRRWRATDDGTAVYEEIERLALLEAGDGVPRVEVNELMAKVRRDGLDSGDGHRHVACNNSFRACIARELRAEHARLRPLIEVRRRTST